MTDVSWQSIFRVAIAILKINEIEICNCKTVGDLFSFISTMTSRLWAADKLISVGVFCKLFMNRWLNIFFPSYNIISNQSLDTRTLQQDVKRRVNCSRRKQMTRKCFVHDLSGILLTFVVCDIWLAS